MYSPQYITVIPVCLLGMMGKSDKRADGYTPVCCSTHILIFLGFAIKVPGLVGQVTLVGSERGFCVGMLFFFPLEIPKYLWFEFSSFFLFFSFTCFFEHARIRLVSATCFYWCKMGFLADLHD